MLTSLTSWNWRLYYIIQKNVYTFAKSFIIILFTIECKNRSITSLPIYMFIQSSSHFSHIFPSIIHRKKESIRYKHTIHIISLAQRYNIYTTNIIEEVLSTLKRIIFNSKKSMLRKKILFHWYYRSRVLYLNKIDC